MSLKVLVTGGTGLVGFFILKRLSEAGYIITALVRAKTTKSENILSLDPRIKIIYTDLADYDALEDACKDQDLIVHAAALVSLDPADRTKLFKSNVQGTVHLVNAALATSVKKFIYISSIAALSDRPDQIEHDELIPWDLKTNHSHYALTKHFAEMEVWRGSAEGLEVGILNPSVVLGKWDESHHSMQVFTMVKKGISFFPTGSTGWVDVRDIARAVQAYIEKDIFNQQILINGHNESYQSVLNKIAMSYSKHIPRYALPRVLAQLGARMYTLFRSFGGPFTSLPPSAVKYLFNQASYNNARSLELLDIQYTPLRETIDWIAGGK